MTYNEAWRLRNVSPELHKHWGVENLHFIDEILDRQMYIHILKTNLHTSTAQMVWRIVLHSNKTTIQNILQNNKALTTVQHSQATSHPPQIP